MRKVMIAHRLRSGACRTVLQIVPVVLIGLLAAPSAMADRPDRDGAAEATETIDRAKEAVALLHGTLDTLMQSEADFDQRMARILETVRATFHVQRIARTITGAGWRRLDDEQQHELRVALADLIAAFYAYEFFSDRGDGFVALSAEEVGDGRVIVHTELQREGKDNISLVYHLLEDRIFNVVVNGISDTSLRRAQYGTVFRDEGFDGLLATMREQIDKQRAKGADE